MKLSDLMEDLNNAVKQLKEKYSTEISGRVSVNPDNLTEFFLTLTISTKPVAVEIAAPASIASTNETQG
jgi:hypothetical protein